MKPTLSIAVACLLGLASSVKIQKSNLAKKRTLMLHNYSQLEDHNNDTDDIAPEIENKLFL